MEASLRQFTPTPPANASRLTDDEREMMSLLSSTFEDDEGNLGYGWKRLMLPYLKETVAPSINVKDYRELFGRPVRLLRTLTGMSEKDAAGFLKLKLTDYRQLEARGLNEVNIFEVSRAIVALAVGMSKVMDERYVRAAWLPTLDPKEAKEVPDSADTRRVAENGIEEFVSNFCDGPNDVLRIVL